jgi:hypothetical protein
MAYDGGLATAPGLRHIATLNRLKSAFEPATVLLAAALLYGCGNQRQSPQNISRACAELSNRMANEESRFLVRAKGIREQHLLLQDYDRQMIGALTARRSEIESTSLIELSISEEVAGCSGKRLDELRQQARQQMSSLQSYLNTMRRALKDDPDGIFVDRP